MENILKLYTYVDGVNDTPFPSEENQAVIGAFKYEASRMAGAPVISATIVNKLCLDDLWSDKVYVNFRNEKHYVMNTPSSSKDNEDERYSHSVEFMSEREILNHIYFIDAVQADSTLDRPKSNSTKVEFMGDIQEFVGRLNSCLSYHKLQYTAVIDDGITSEIKNVSFEDQFILSALQEIYNVYGIPYYFVGRTIHIGYEETAIPDVMKYGSSEALLSINKDNANYQIVNCITGTGSSDNLPSYYPNKTSKGDVKVKVSESSTGIKEGDITIVNQKKFADKVLSTDKVSYLFVSENIQEDMSASIKSCLYYSDGDDIYGAVKDKNLSGIFPLSFKKITDNQYSSSMTIWVNIDVKRSCRLVFDFDFYEKDISVGTPNLSYTRELSFNGGEYSNLTTEYIEANQGTYTIKYNLVCSVTLDTTHTGQVPTGQLKARYNLDTFNPYWTINNVTKVDLSDLGLSMSQGATPQIGDYFTQIVGALLPVSDVLMPPIYRETSGAERFYKAKNDTYQKPDGQGYYIFQNLFSENNQKQYKVSFDDIKPTIKGLKNSQGLRIDMFSEFAYDKNDNDEYDVENNRYVHSYFYGKLRKFDGEYGFNLFDHAADNETMKISMTSGVCGSCTFEIGVGEESQKNIVQVDSNGDLMYDEDGNVLLGDAQDRQNDTSKYEVWIALKKDDTTYPTYKPMPNVASNLKPSVEDTFVITGINLPDAFVYNAENELKEALIKYMFENNVEKFNFPIKFSRIYFAENPEMLNLLNENSRIIVEYNGQQHTLYVDSYSYTVDESDSLPEIEVNLVDTLTIGKNSLQEAIDGIKSDIASSMTGGDILAQGLRYFLRKDINDTAKGYMTFKKGATFNDEITIANNLFVSGKTGSRISVDGAAEFLSLVLRAGLSLGSFMKGISGANIDEKGAAEMLSLVLREGLQSSNFSTGSLGTGYCLKKDANGDSYLEVDRALFRKTATFIELLIQRLRYVGGQIILTPASMNCSRVEELEDVYRCYFENTDGEKTIKQEFVIGDFARCQTFNIKEGVHENVTNTYYWRAVVGTGDNYIDLSKTDCDAGSTIPSVGDDIVQLGNKTDATRQSAIILAAYGDDAPYFKLYKGINSYSLEGKEFISFSRSEVMIIADKIKFSSGESVKDELDKINGNLTDVNEKVDKAVSDLAENIDFVNQLSSDLESVKNQVDGAIESYFEKTDPTTSNYPASSWNTEELKQAHANDTYTNISTGKSWKWVKNGSTWEWSVITDTATEKALALAGKAQDTADGKRRVFVSTPTNASTYDVGDLWVNATYGGYSNDLLRCKVAKEANAAWSIDHWELASKYTDDTKANQAIKDAANAKAAADNAQQDATDAKERLDDWASDNTISPTEKPALKDEIARIDADKTQISNGYNKYGLGLPTAFDNAYTSYRTVLVSLTASEPESIAIPSDFKTKQENYYSERTIALTKISDAAKDYAESVSNNLEEYKKTVTAKFEQTNNSITAAVTTSKEYTNEAVSNIQVGTRNIITKRNTFHVIDADYIDASSVSSVINDNKERETTVTAIAHNNSWVATRYINNIDTSNYLSEKIEKETYVFSFDYKSNCECYACFDFRIPVIRTFAVLENTNGEWKRGYCVQNFKSATSQTHSLMEFGVGKVLDNVRVPGGYKVGDYITYKNIKLSRGNKGWDDSIAPEDITSSIDSVNNTLTTYREKTDSRLNILEDKIALTVTSDTLQQTKTEILNSAATTAQSKADAAKQAAISTAAQDATNKADAAKNAAISDAAGKYVTTTIYEQRVSSIEADLDGVSLKASQTETKVTEIDGEITSLENRVSEAEIAVQPDNIAAIVTSTVKVGGVNLLLNSYYSRSLTNTSQKDTYAYYNDLSVYLEKDKTYVLSSKTNGKWASNHNDFGKNNVTIWITKGISGTYHRVISSDSMKPDGSYGSVFTHTGETGEYVLRFNIYDAGTFWFKETKIENGTISTDYSKAPQDQYTDNSYLSRGKMLYRDPTFAEGKNSIKLYNNAGNGNVKIERVNNVAGNPNTSGYCLKITAKGAANPNWGGFSFQNQTKANQILLTKIVAKIPASRKIAFATNATGDNSRSEWLTSNKGTGEWSEYIFRLICGSTGTFSTTNFFYLKDGTTPTEASPLVWYVSFATVYDVTGVDDTPTKDEIKTGITIEPNVINVFGKAINLTGAVTFSSLATDAQDKINTAQSTANTANTAANNAQNTANSAVSAVTASKDTIAKELGYSSFADMQAKPTIIDGGYIRTSYLESDAIRATIVTAEKISSLNITTGNITITNGARIGDLIVKDNTLYVDDEEKTAINIGGSTATKKVVLGGQTVGVGITIKPTTKSLTGLKIYCEGQSSVALDIWGQNNNIAMKAFGGCDWTIRDSSKWIMPGLLWCARMSNGGTVYDQFGDACGMVTTRRTEVGKYLIQHNLGHGEYVPVVIADQGSTGNLFANVEDVQYDHFYVRIIHKDQSYKDASFYVAILGRTKNP